MRDIQKSRNNWCYFVHCHYTDLHGTHMQEGCGHICLHLLPCVWLTKTQIPLTRCSMTDDAIAWGCIGGLGSPFCICGCCTLMPMSYNLSTAIFFFFFTILHNISPGTKRTGNLVLNVPCFNLVTDMFNSCWFKLVWVSDVWGIGG